VVWDVIDEGNARDVVEVVRYDGLSGCSERRAPAGGARQVCLSQRRWARGIPGRNCEGGPVSRQAK